MFRADYLLVGLLATRTLFFIVFFPDLKKAIFVPMSFIFIFCWVPIEISPIFLLLLSLPNDIGKSLRLLHIFLYLIELTLEFFDSSFKDWLRLLARSFNEVVVTESNQKLVRVFDFAAWKICNL